ncbi:MAG: glycine zipper 2TM domain-containing protein [Burkholderiales bacterium]|nr:glycine zipper 2TM domain-containing protein [Burkholderiales bacterium]
MDKRIQTAVLVVAVAVLAGCAQGLGGGSYTRDEARREQNVRLGVVESVRPVQIEGTRSGIGPAAGAVVGGVAGSTVGGGRGSTVAAVIGAVAGGVAGQAVEEGTTRKNGVEVTVKLNNGALVAIVQEADETFRAGDRVRILSDGRTSRVTH